MAPIRGVTDAIYRNTFAELFDGFDLAIAPFISEVRSGRLKKSFLKDLLPERNTSLAIVPQIIGKHPEQFIFLSRRLYDLGYETVNWNLGCPYPMVARKGRGSGMLPFPEKVAAFLDRVVPALPNRLSIKTRLGRHDKGEILPIIEIFNQFPLAEVIIHPRTGVQMYEGCADVDMFEQCLAHLRLPVVYNGDIVNVKGFQALAGRFEGVSRWMIGRGALADPFLPGRIKGLFPGEEERIGNLYTFHQTLFQRYEKVLFGPAHLADRMKCIWRYLAGCFVDGQTVLKKIQRTKHAGKLQEIVEQFFDTNPALIE